MKEIISHNNYARFIPHNCQRLEFLAESRSEIPVLTFDYLFTDQRLMAEEAAGLKVKACHYKAMRECKCGHHLNGERH